MADANNPNPSAQEQAAAAQAAKNDKAMADRINWKPVSSQAVRQNNIKNPQYQKK